MLLLWLCLRCAVGFGGRERERGIRTEPSACHDTTRRHTPKQSQAKQASQRSASLPCPDLSARPPAGEGLLSDEPSATTRNGPAPASLVVSRSPKDTLLARGPACLACLLPAALAPTPAPSPSQHCPTPKHSGIHASLGSVGRGLAPRPRRRLVGLIDPTHTYTSSLIAAVFFPNTHPPNTNRRGRSGQARRGEQQADGGGVVRVCCCVIGPFGPSVGCPPSASGSRCVTTFDYGAMHVYVCTRRAAAPTTRTAPPTHTPYIPTSPLTPQPKQPQG